MGFLVLIAGLALWTLAHLFKRLAPERRAAMGAKGRLPLTIAILGSIVLMVVGYRMADGAFVWGRHPATVGLNNLLTLFAVYLFAASGMKTAITARIRHPQLTAVKFWAVAHLLVNGDSASFILFGGLLLWAVLEVVIINQQDGKLPLTKPQPSLAREFTAIAITLLLYGVTAYVHGWLGYPVHG